jgi:hypothetical protein
MDPLRTIYLPLHEPILDEAMRNMDSHSYTQVRLSTLLMLIMVPDLFLRCALGYARTYNGWIILARTRRIIRKFCIRCNYTIPGREGAIARFSRDTRRHPLHGVGGSILHASHQRPHTESFGILTPFIFILVFIIIVIFLYIVILVPGLFPLKLPRPRICQLPHFWNPARWSRYLRW